MLYELEKEIRFAEEREASRGPEKEAEGREKSGESQKIPGTLIATVFMTAFLNNLYNIKKGIRKTPFSNDNRRSLKVICFLFRTQVRKGQKLEKGRMKEKYARGHWCLLNEQNLTGIHYAFWKMCILLNIKGGVRRPRGNTDVCLISHARATHTWDFKDCL